MKRKLANVLSSQQFDLETINEVFRIAKIMKEKPDPNLLRGKVVGILFYEESTRTRWSFETATLKLGGQCVGTENARKFSSAVKGETLEDTIRVLSGYGLDAIVIRYDEMGGADIAQNVSMVPIINAGDGTGQHPTQALLDLFTIQEHFGEIKGLKIGMVGDLERGRTVRSLSYFLAKHFPDNEIYFISPEESKIREDVKKYLDDKNIKWQESSELVPFLPELDVIYQTRVQTERFKDNPELIKTVKEKGKNLHITGETLKTMKENAIIMHPLPRIDEIAKDVDEDKRAKYFKQAENGLYIRMALLSMIIEGY